jgi:branched-chain amino acid transport system permease protein
VTELGMATRWAASCSWWWCSAAWAARRAFVASLFFGAVQTFSVALDYSLADLAAWLGLQLTPDSGLHQVLSITVAQTAPVLPYLLMVLMLIFRPTGLMGTREG